ncbi:hypothetical protein F4860DRAFT_508232 [Xylaria cubensis]|nr:hypothetical protein F4860DRAFT_508232 [Xylaria cubensis]
MAFVIRMDYCNSAGLLMRPSSANMRVYSYMASTYAARWLSYGSSIALVFRDATKCHQWLYQFADILHQDISPGNIIILDSQDEGKPRGILIDLKPAIELAGSLETEINVTGARPLMAIDVLRRERHPYRHDLESFLYVFLWTIITNQAESPPETSKLQQWSNGDWDELATPALQDSTPNTISLTE